VAGSDAGGGDKKWQWASVADQISETVLFRVSDYNNGVASDVSAANNYIFGKLSMVSPVSTDTWTIGEVVALGSSISWNKTGALGDLLIEYSTNGFSDESENFTIESAYASGTDGQVDYQWAEAGVIGANRKISDIGKIRITTDTLAASLQLSVLSDPFKIRPSFTSFTKPADGVTTWYSDETDTVNQKIEWVSNSGTKGDDSDPTCLIQYNIGGAGYSTVPGAGAVACGQGALSYTWSPMNDLRSSLVGVKISYNDYTTINTDAAFGVINFNVYPRITVTSPDTNTKLVVGSDNANLITWTYSSDTTGGRTVEIRYDKDNEGTFPVTQVIVDDVAVADGQVDWDNIPNIVGTSVKVRVFDNDFTTSTDDSDPFKVMAGITNLAPTAGENRTADTTTNITWDYSGTVANFNVYYAPDGAGESYDQIGTNLASATYCVASSCTWSWDETQTDNVDTVINTNLTNV